MPSEPLKLTVCIVVMFGGSYSELVAQRLEAFTAFFKEAEKHALNFKAELTTHVSHLLTLPLTRKHQQNETAIVSPSPLLRHCCCSC